MLIVRKFVNYNIKSAYSMPKSIPCHRWVCGRCRKLQQHSGSACRDCSAPKVAGMSTMKLPGDWTCSKCNYCNFASRKDCRGCGDRKGLGSWPVVEPRELACKPFSPTAYAGISLFLSPRKVPKGETFSFSIFLQKFFGWTRSNIFPTI